MQIRHCSISKFRYHKSIPKFKELHEERDSFRIFSLCDTLNSNTYKKNNTLIYGAFGLWLA